MESRRPRTVLHVGRSPPHGVPVRRTPTLEVGTPLPLFILPGRGWSDFAVTADGKRFLAVVPQAFAGEQPLTVILNWTAEVRR